MISDFKRKCYLTFIFTRHKQESTGNLFVRLLECMLIFTVFKIINPVISQSELFNKSKRVLCQAQLSLSYYDFSFIWGEGWKCQNYTAILKNENDLKNEDGRKDNPQIGK